MFGDPLTNPKGWEMTALKNVAIGKLKYGSGAAATEYNDEIRYVRITDIISENELGNDIVSPSHLDVDCLLQEGDVLFARSGATVGKTFKYSKKWGKCVFAGYLIRFVPNLEKVLPDYVLAYTKTNHYSEFIKQEQKVVAQPNVNAQQYGNMILCIPPLTLQKRFIDFVEQVDKSKYATVSLMHLVQRLSLKRTENYVYVNQCICDGKFLHCSG